MGMAPTTSTTLALALGDAISIALLERCGFSPANFQELHPGGNLGRRLTTVTDLMHSGADMPLIGRDRRMSEALIEMTAKSFGCVGVIGDDGRLIGIITDGDLRRHMGGDFLDRNTADIMTPSPKTIRHNALAAEALWVMSTRSITSLFVAKDSKPIGILHLHDCLRAGIA